MKAENIKIGIATENQILDINGAQYKLWTGYITYLDKPFMDVSGLEALKQHVFDDGRVADRGILLSDAANSDTKIGNIKIKTGTSQKNGKEYISLKSTGVTVFDLFFPVSAFLNNNSACLRVDTETALYLTDPDLGGANYLKNGKEIPVFSMESDNCLGEDEMLELVTVLEQENRFPGFQDWWISHFPSSSATREFEEKKTAAARRDELMRSIKTKRVAVKNTEIPY